MKNIDQIKIEDLKVFAHHGVYPEETEKGQDFYINATLYTDTENAGHSDELSHSTNYGEVCLFIDQFMRENTYKLLEAVVENLAEAILLKFPLIQSLDLEIRKPQAPIPLPFSSVSVKIHRGWHDVYVAFGSNMGDKRKYVDVAIFNLNKDPHMKDMRVSDYLITEPYGGVEQDEFLNGAFFCRTLYSPYGLLDRLHEEENLAGRTREIHWGPRTLDLDILFYDELIMTEENLTIPHGDMVNRRFVLEPLKELNPYLVHPVYHKSVSQMLDAITK